MSKHERHPPGGKPQITIVSDGTARGTRVLSADGQDLTTTLNISSIEIDISPENGPIARLVIDSPILRLKATNLLLFPTLREA